MACFCARVLVNFATRVDSTGSILFKEKQFTKRRIDSPLVNFANKTGSFTTHVFKANAIDSRESTSCEKVDEL